VNSESLSWNGNLHAHDIHQENATVVTNNAKGVSETGMKRSRSQSLAFATGPQRVPLGPGRARVAPPLSNNVNARALPGRVFKPQIPIQTRRVSNPVKEVIIPSPTKEEQEEEEEMDIENDNDANGEAEIDSLIVGEKEVEEMVVPQESEDEEEAADLTKEKHPYVWPDVSPERAERYRREIQEIRDTFDDGVDMFDTTMVSEYADEIFEYMNELEVYNTLFYFVPS